MGYIRFNATIPSLENLAGSKIELEWENVTETEDGKVWIVRQVGGDGYMFRASICGREFDPLPASRKNCCTVEKAIANAINQFIVTVVDIKKRQEYLVTVRRCDFDD